MANAYNNQPIVIDSDFASWRTAANKTAGIRVGKITLSVGPGGPSAAGTVFITAPSDGSTLYPPMAVPVSSAAYTVLYIDNLGTNSCLTWRDFAVTGVTATGSKLFLWRAE